MDDSDRRVIGLESKPFQNSDWSTGFSRKPRRRRRNGLAVLELNASQSHESFEKPKRSFCKAQAGRLAIQNSG